MDHRKYKDAERAVRTELARRLRWESVPDAVWLRLDDEDLDLVEPVILRGDQNSWDELEETAREERAALGNRTPPDEPEGDAAPEEIGVELGDGTYLRGEVFSEVAAEMADRRRDVYNFRRSYLRGGLLTEEEAAAFQLPKRHAARLLTAEEAEAFLDGRETGRRPLDRSPVAPGRLRRLSATLARFYGWRERDAARFVLTGETPAYRPVRVAVGFGESVRDVVPTTARIVVTADVWVDPKEVSDAYQAVRRQILGGDRAIRRMDGRSLEVVRFVIRQRAADGALPRWSELQDRWNREHPKAKEKYRARSGLKQAYERAHERLIPPGYDRPRWEDADPS